MSNTIDNRIVEMQFDNANFEKNVKTSINSLNNLKQSINDAGASGSFENMEASLDKIANRFSTLGVIGMTVISNLTTSAMSAIGNIANKLEQMVVGGGLSRAMNIERAKFQLEGLGLEWEKVYGAINFAVSGTAYSLDAAALAASNLAASGVQIDDTVATLTDLNQIADNGSESLSSMGQALGAISGVAAMTNSDFSSIASIFATVAGQGQLMTMQLRQLETRGMNAAAKIGEYMGKSEAEIRQMVTKGEIDFETFSEAMYNSFYSHAKDANKTVTGITANIKSAFAKIGAEAIEPIIQNEGKLVEMLNTFKKKVDEFKVAVLPLMRRISEIVIAGIENVNKILEKVSFDDYKNKIADLFNPHVSGEQFTRIVDSMGSRYKHVFTHVMVGALQEYGVAMDTTKSEWGQLCDAINNGYVTFDILRQVFDKFKSVLDGTSDAFDTATGSLQDFSEIVDEVISGKWGDGEERIKNLTEAGYNYAVIQNLVNEKLGSSVRHTSDLVEATENLSDAEMIASGYTEEQIKVLRDLQLQAEETGTPLAELIEEMNKPTATQLLIESVQNIITAVHQMASTIRTAWRDIFPKSTADQVYTVIEAFHDFTEWLVMTKDRQDDVTRSLRGLFAILDIIVYTIKTVAGASFRVLKGILEALNIDIFKYTANLGDALVIFRDWIKEHDLVGKAFEYIGYAIGGVIKVIGKLIEAVRETEFIKTTFESIKETVKSFATYISNVFPNVSITFKDFGQSLSDIDNMSLSGISEAVKNFGINIKATFSDNVPLLTNFKDHFSTMTETIKSNIESLDFSKFKEFFTNFGDNIKDVFDGMNIANVVALIVSSTFAAVIFKTLGFVSDFEGSLQDITGALSGFITGLGTSLNEIATGYKFASVATGLKEIAIAIAILAAACIAFSFIDPGKLWNAVGALMAIIAVIGALTAVILVLTNKGGFLSGVNSGAALAGISALIISLGATIKVLSDVAKDTDNALNALSMLAFVIVGVIALMASMTALAKWSGGAKLTASASAILMVAVTMSVLANTLKKLNKLDPEQTKGSVVLLGVLMLELEALLALSSRAGKYAARAAVMILAIGVTMSIMVSLIKKINKMRPDEIVKGLAVIAVLEVFIMALIGCITLMSNSGKHAAKAGLMLIEVAVTMLIMVDVIKLINKMTTQEIEKGLAVIAAMEILIGALLKFVTSLPAGNNQTKAGLTIISLAGAMLIMSVAMKILATISAPDLIKSTAAMVACLESLGRVCQKTAGMGTSAKTIRSLAVAIAVMAAALAILSIIKPERLLFATAALSAVMLSLGYLLKNLAKLQEGEFGKDSITAISVMMGILLALTGVIWLLSTFEDTSNLLEAAAGLSLLLLAFSASVRLLSDGKRFSKSSISSADNLMKIIVAMGVVVYELAMVLGFLATSGATSGELIGAATALSEILLAFSVAVLIISNSKRFPSSSGKQFDAFKKLLIIMGAIVAELAVCIGALANTGASVESMVGSATALSEILLAFSLAMVVISAAGAIPTNNTNLEDMFKLLAFAIGEIGIVLGLLMQLPNTDNALILATSISEVLLALSGAMVLLSAAAAIPGASNISALFLPMTEFLLGIGALAGVIGSLDILTDGALLSAVQSGMDVLVEICYGIGDMIGSLVGGLLDGVTSGLPAMGEHLADFSKNIEPFFEMISQLDKSAVDKVSIIADAILELTKSEMLDAVATFIGGMNSELGFGGLGTGLSDFLDAVEPFIDTIIELPDGAAEAAESIGNMFLSLTKSEIIAGITDLLGLSGFESFGESLEYLGDGVKKYVESIDGLTQSDYDAIAMSVDGVTGLVDLAKAMPFSSDSWVGKICGLEGLDTFGDQLPKLGAGLLLYAIAVKALTEDDIEHIKLSVDAVSALVDVANAMPVDDDTIVGKFTGLTGLDEFGADIELLGKGIVAYVDSVRGLGNNGIAIISMSASAVTKIAEITESLDANGGIITWFSDKSDSLSNLGTQMESLGESLTKYFDSISGITDWDVFSKSAEALKKFTDIMMGCDGLTIASVEALEDAIYYFADGFAFEAIETINDTATDFASAISDFIDQGKAQMETDFGLLDTFFTRIIAPLFNTAISNMMDKVTEDGKDDYSKVYTLGQYFGVGLAAGMTGDESVKKVSQAAKYLGKLALKSLKDVLDINSPSKITTEYGEFTSLGFVNGIKHFAKNAYDVSEDLGNYALEGLSNAISHAVDAVDSDVDTTVTITPVIDLDSAKSGVNAINGMLNASHVAVSTVGSINASMNAIQNRAFDSRVYDDSKVVSAISELQNNFDNLNHSISNLQVVMDTGSLVGSIVNPIDNALGRKAIYAGRSN